MDKKPAVDFGTFVLSLGSSALIHLGEAPDPISGEKQAANLPLAQQSIDLLALLQEKTKGNLTDAEGRLLESLLFDLRMRYIAAVNATPTAPDAKSEPKPVAP